MQSTPIRNGDKRKRVQVPNVDTIVHAGCVIGECQIAPSHLIFLNPQHAHSSLQMGPRKRECDCTTHRQPEPVVVKGLARCRGCHLGGVRDTPNVQEESDTHSDSDGCGSRPVDLIPKRTGCRRGFLFRCCSARRGSMEYTNPATRRSICPSRGCRWKWVTTNPDDISTAGSICPKCIISTGTPIGPNGVPRWERAGIECADVDATDAGPPIDSGGAWWCGPINKEPRLPLKRGTIHDLPICRQCPRDRQRNGGLLWLLSRRGGPSNDNRIAKRNVR